MDNVLAAIWPLSLDDMDDRLGSFGGHYRPTDGSATSPSRGETKEGSDTATLYIKSRDGFFVVKFDDGAFNLVRCEEPANLHLDRVYVVVKDWYGKVNLLDFWSLLRRSDQLYFLESRAGWAAYPLSIGEFMVQQVLGWLGRWIVPVSYRAAVILMSRFGKSVDISGVETYLDTARDLCSSSAEELIKRFGYQFVDYFTGHNPQAGLSKDFLLPYAYHANFLEQTIGPLRGKNVLEIGCGYGVQSLIFHGADSKVVGLDIQHSRAKTLLAFEREGLTGVCASTLASPFGQESFDVIYAHDTIQHVSDITQTVAECHRVLRPGGYLAISEVNPLSLTILFRYNGLVPFRRASKQLYRNLRRKHLQEIASLDRAQLDAIVEKTDSFVYEDLDRLTASGFDPGLLESIRRENEDREELYEYRHPLTGYCEERLITPERLIRSLVKGGFQRERIRIMYHHYFASVFGENPLTRLFIVQYLALAQKES